MNQKQLDASLAVLLKAKESVSYTDRDVLGALIQSQDKWQDFVAGDDNYVWWHLLGYHFCPRRVLEIGTRFGYSLWSIVSGSGWGPSDVSMVVFDAECDPGTKNPLDVCRKWFRDHDYENLTLMRGDTQKMTNFDFQPPFDLAVVDADHSAGGCYHDMGLVLPVVRPGGVIVVDDTAPGGEVRAGCERFCADKQLPYVYVPTLRGVHLVGVP